jgi:hypothetical protein
MSSKGSLTRFVALWGVVLTMSGAPPAVAQQDRFAGRKFGQSAGQPQPQRVPARQSPADNRGGGHGMQMTPEQREQLRRDIHDHGREIYRDRGGQGRRR